MTTKEYILKAIASCQQALAELEHDEKRKSLGSLDYAFDRITAAKWTLINEITEVDGKL